MKPTIFFAGLLLAARGRRVGTSPFTTTGWIDLNKNGKKDVYEDPALPVAERVERFAEADDAG